MAEAARTGPEQRTVLGGRARGGRPVVTMTIIGLCLVSYVLQWTVPGWTDRWVFSPVAGAFEPWRFLSAAFLHAPNQLLHIVFNMVALWMVGPYLEQALGRLRFTTLYLLSALGGSVAAVLLAPALGDWYQGMVGASGAVFGLFGAVLVVLRRLGGDARSILGVIVLNVVLGFVLPGIAWQAHLGGLVVGAVLGAAYAYAPRERRALVGVLAPVLVGVVLVGSALALYGAYGLV
ncbi:rhomboid family intramembrane serine protease [Cellulomonas shaoxiangyii]|uniref:rhomboid family intramembrane serine protease n=1 Tax=Cellulomonas shaoxiangyii TaxID=2566013 RepID=UPI00312C712A